MKRLLLLLLVAALSLCGVARADLGMTYTDKVVWRGFELFGETDGIAPQLTFDAGPVNVAARGVIATHSGYDALERWDAQVTARQRAGPLEFTEGYGYYYYPDSDLDFQELWATVGIPMGSVTPRYTLVRAEADGDVESSWLHVVGVDVDLTEKARCFAEATYNEGFNPFGGSIEPGWSHLLAGASLDLPLGEQLSVTPAVYYQHTLDEAVNSQENQVWFSVGLFMKF